MDQQPDSPQSDPPSCLLPRCFSRCCRPCITQKSSKSKRKAEEPPQVLLKPHQNQAEATAAAPVPTAESEIKRIRVQFAERVSLPVLKQLLDRLESDGVFNPQEKDAILEENATTFDKARCLADAVLKKGPEACRKMSKHLLRKDPTLSQALGLAVPPPATGRKPVALKQTEMKEGKDSDTRNTSGKTNPPSVTTGQVNEAFEDSADPDKIAPSDGEAGSTEKPSNPTEPVSYKVELKEDVPPKAPLWTQTSDDQSFQREFLEAHNAYRKLHQAPPLVLNGEMCAEAQRWAEHLLEINRLESSYSDNGENTYHTYSSDSVKPTGREAVDSWYKGVHRYDYSRPGFQKDSGSFTQVVWKSSKELGVGVASDGKRAFIVGHYRPAGNFTNEGFFEKNVLPIVSTTPRISADDAFRKEFLDAHNRYRAMHRAPPLVLNPEMCAAAQKFADHLLELNRLERSGADVGENTYSMSSSKYYEITGSEAVDHWYANISHYDFSQPGYQRESGNFTQLVWKDSKELGVGMASNGKRSFVVGHYRPTGNIDSEDKFRTNVLRKAYIQPP